jgi:hypothetical protein
VGHTRGHAPAGRGPKEIAALPQPAWAIALAAPLALAGTCLEAGLTEEFLFRVAFQTRAAAWLRSEVAGLVAMAVLFGLAHAPGYVLELTAKPAPGQQGFPDGSLEFSDLKRLTDWHRSCYSRLL